MKIQKGILLLIKCFTPKTGQQSFLALNGNNADDNRNNIGDDDIDNNNNNYKKCSSWKENTVNLLKSTASAIVLHHLKPVLSEAQRRANETLALVHLQRQGPPPCFWRGSAVLPRRDRGASTLICDTNIYCKLLLLLLPLSSFLLFYYYYNY